jgi:general secretion pathway protein G
MMTQNSEKGFSLIELIVVLVILGLLASIVGGGIIKDYAKSKHKIARIQIAEFEGALEKFTFDNGRCPTSSEGLDALINNSMNLSSWNGPYLKKNFIPKDPWGHDYIYRCPGQYADFDLLSRGPDGVEGGEGENEDITNGKQQNAERKLPNGLLSIPRQE